MTSHHSGYTPRPGDRIDVRVVGATVVDADTDDVYRCRKCRRPVGAGHKMDCSTGRAETRATEADRTTDVSLTSALAAAQEAYRRYKQAAPAGDEPLKTVTADAVKVGDIIKCGEEWLRITRASRRTGPTEHVTLDVSATAYVPPIPADPIEMSPIGLFDVYANHGSNAPTTRGERIETVAAADIRVGDVVRHDDEWLKVTRTRHSGVPERIALDVETIPATEYVPAIPADPIVLEPDALLDIRAGSSTSALLAAGIATVYEPEPTEALTKGQRIAAELHRLADRLATAGDDVPSPHVSLCCGHPRPSGVPAARGRVEALADRLGLPAPTTSGTGASRYYEAEATGDIRVWVYTILPDTPGTCTHCGQTCGCGGAA